MKYTTLPMGGCINENLTGMGLKMGSTTNRRQRKTQRNRRRGLCSDLEVNKAGVKRYKTITGGTDMKEEVFLRLKKISERLKKKYQAERVILFGSYATGEATEDSDVDILVIAPSEERFFERMAKVLELTRDLYNGLALSPIVLRPEEVEKRIKMGDQFVQEILDIGIEL